MDYSDSAFPRTVTDWNPDSEKREVTSEGGMSLRDYFAAKAMQGLIAEPVEHGRTSFSAWITEDFTSTKDTKRPDRLATAAYRMADAMLKARNA
jgi:hypothetical protein